MNAPEFIMPDWPAPDRVRALQTTRAGGVSEDNYASLNLGTHVGDSPNAVARNRDLVLQAAELPARPSWLEQVHGATLVESELWDRPAVADASWTDRTGMVCGVLTADCLPLLICDKGAQRVAAVHAGWRGLCAGIIENAVDNFRAAGIDAADLLVWLGPAIGPDAYEVDAPVRDGLLSRAPECVAAFTVSRPGHWHLDLYATARILLEKLGVAAIYGGDFCTLSDARFFSHRREIPCGRQASLVWLSA